MKHHFLNINDHFFFLFIIFLFLISPHVLSFSLSLSLYLSLSMHVSICLSLILTHLLSFLIFLMSKSMSPQQLPLKQSALLAIIPLAHQSGAPSVSMDISAPPSLQVQLLLEEDVQKEDGVMAQTSIPARLEPSTTTMAPQAPLPVPRALLVMGTIYLSHSLKAHIQDIFLNFGWCSILAYKLKKKKSKARVESALTDRILT